MSDKAYSGTSTDDWIKIAKLKQNKLDAANKVIKNISDFVKGIEFSGKKCEEGQCSIFLHWDNIDKIKKYLEKYGESNE